MTGCFLVVSPQNCLNFCNGDIWSNTIFLKLPTFDNDEDNNDGDNDDDDDHHHDDYDDNGNGKDNDNNEEDNNNKNGHDKDNITKRKKGFLMNFFCII